MNIKILGSGCASCKKLEKLTLKALKELNKSEEIEKVEDYMKIMNDYKVMTTPALVVDEVVVIKGHVPSYKDVLEALK